jgi:hypothetical protein
MSWSKWGHHCTSSLDMLSTWALHTADLAMVSAPETIQICWRCINCTDHNRLRSSGLAEKKAVLYFLSTEIVALPFAMDANSFRYLDFIKNKIESQLPMIKAHLVLLWLVQRYVIWFDKSFRFYLSTALPEKRAVYSTCVKLDTHRNGYEDLLSWPKQSQTEVGETSR